MNARRKQRWRLDLIIGALLLGFVVVALVMSGGTPARTTSQAGVRVWIEGGDEVVAKRTVDAVKAMGRNATTVSNSASADVTLHKTQVPGSMPVLTRNIGTPAALQSGAIIAPRSSPSYYLATSALSQEDTSKLTDQLKTQSSNTWDLVALGDVIIGRTVYLQMRRYNDPNRAFAPFAETIRSADLALADLECTISDAKTIVTDGGMTFASPQTAASGLKFAGIDAVNVANNHSFNVGSAGFVDTLDAMKNLGIPTFGGGRTEAEAHAPLILTTHGVKVALLGYSSIVGSTPAGADSPGMAHLSMAPWDPFNEAEAVRMEQDIKAAKTKADLVMVYYHWGTEYTHDANADQRQIAHRAIDAGADLILGTHPHWVQGVEWYKDKLITYSLGNFIFDQEWSTKTKQGTFLKAKFDGKNLVSAELVPYQIEDYLQPRPVNATVGQAILQDIFAHSWWPQPQS